LQTFSNVCIFVHNNCCPAVDKNTTDLGVTDLCSSNARASIIDAASFSGERLRNGLVSVCLSVPSIDSSSDVLQRLPQPGRRRPVSIVRAMQQRAGSINGVVRGGSTQSCSNVLSYLDSPGCVGDLRTPEIFDFRPVQRVDGLIDAREVRP